MVMVIWLCVTRACSAKQNSTTVVRFDSTLGFPGEGPSKSQSVGDWKLVFANVTAWQSLVAELGRDNGLFKAADVICVQEHHLVGDDQIGKAQDKAKELGWVFEGTSAIKTIGEVSGKVGSRAGVGILWRPTIAISQVKKRCARFMSVVWDLGSLGSITLGTVYGSGSGSGSGWKW